MFYAGATSSGRAPTESGGPLSHGAVTAREIGIPAVMAIPSVFQTLPDGVRAMVNGTEGRVALA